MEMEQYLKDILDVLTTQGLQIIIKALASVLFWIIGRRLIGLATRMLSNSLKRQSIDETVQRYAASSLDILLNITLIIAIFGYLGVETATFAAILASAGVAIGLAWSGLLSNFAAGAFMVVLRPFGVGDFVEVAGTLGDVEEIGLFVTTINTPDNVRMFIGNNAIFTGKIKNFTANPYRRVELTAQLSHGTDPHEAIALLKESLAAIPNVCADPAPSVEILEFNLAGPVLAVRPFCHNDHYWGVYFATNAAIRDTFAEAGYSVPDKHLTVHTQAAEAA